jgi:diazepam-binding inhibitor (GABA receptor modulating acyl-CoA-binding protein)
MGRLGYLTIPESAKLWFIVRDGFESDPGGGKPLSPGGILSPHEELSMPDLRSTFTTAAADVQKLKRRPSNDQLLELYALYKQSTEGDVKGARPGFLDLTGRAKYDAWSGKKGMTTDKAMQAYVDLFERLKKA